MCFGCAPELATLPTIIHCSDIKVTAFRVSGLTVPLRLTMHIRLLFPFAMASYSTERLILCPYTEADLDDLMILWNDPLVQPLVIDDEIAPCGSELKDALRSSMERAAFGVVIRLKTTGEFMGQVMVTVDPTMREGTFGICLLPKFWGKGYGTEATRYMVDYSFRWFGLQKMSLSVWASNARARAVYKKIGFKIEGRKRGTVRWFKQREYIIFMGILYEEWAAKESRSRVHWYA